MWSRGVLKERAKNVLRMNYWKALLISLVIVIAGGEGGGTFNFNWNFRDGFSRHSPFESNGDYWPLFMGIFMSAFLLIIAVALAYRIFLGYALEVGGKRYFARAAQSDENMNHVGFSFTNGRYVDIMKAMLWKGFINFLWYLALYIPGIVKAYAYAMVPYILADNPHIGYKRALELSNKMTYGHKFDMWVLDLSFIGWYLLGVLALCVGVFFVKPYYNATHAELYLVLRHNALNSGYCSYEELKLSPPVLPDGAY